MAQVIVATPDRRDFECVIHRVAAIAEARAYRAGQDAASSFLLSGFGLAAYRHLADAGQLNVVLEDEQPVAFAILYPPGVPAAHDDPGTQHIRKRYGEVPVVKQVATAPGHDRRGHAALLYRAFQERYPALPLFAAIAEEPRNAGSEAFHAKLGFVRCAEFSAHPDGRKRGIWRRPPER